MEKKVIGIVLGLSTAIAAVIFVVSYRSKPAPAPLVPSPHPHFEAVGTVVHIIDGDTISVHLTWVHATKENVAKGDERVRLSGGIDAPELGQKGGPEATSFIIGLSPIGTEVLLDLDNLASGGAGPYRDPFGRLLAAIYVWTDNAWVNVNAELLKWGLEAWPEHDWFKYTYLSSEFDPDEWLVENYPYVRGWSS